MENIERKKDVKMIASDSAFKNILKGIGISLVITIIALLVLSCVLAFTNTNENIMKPSIIVISGISILLGSIIGTSKISKQGLINGAFIGSLYMILLYLLSSILNRDFSMTTDSIILIVVGIVCGILGGVIGVNKKKK